MNSNSKRTRYFVRNQNSAIIFNFESRRVKTFQHCLLKTLSKLKMLRHFINKHHYYLQINTKLIPVKAIGFFHYFGILAMYSYSTIHAKSLGLSASQIGLILAILPIAILFGPPVFCPLADRLQQHRWFLVTFLLLAAALFMALITIPNIPQTISNSTEFNETLATAAYQSTSLDVKGIVSAREQLENF